jgi:hypothetical protein
VAVKVFTAFRAYVTPNDTWVVLVLPFLVLSAASLTVSLRRLVWNRATLSVAALTLSQAVLVVVHQNQARYALLVLPAVVLLFAVGLQDRPAMNPGLKAGLWAVLIFGLLPVDVVLAHRSRAEGAREAAARQALSSALADVPSDEAVAVEYSDPRFLMFGYAVRPRTALYIAPWYSRDELHDLAATIKVRWLLCDPASPLVGRLPGVIMPARRTSVVDTTLALFRVADER